MPDIDIIKIRDNLLKKSHNEVKTELEGLAYAYGVLDMFNEVKKCLELAPTAEVKG